MLRPFSNISIQQISPYTYKDETGTLKTVARNELIEIDFVSSYEIEEGYEDHTDTCKITLPKNIVLQSDKFLFKQNGSYNVVTGGADSENTTSTGQKLIAPPLLMRGDIVYINDGYWYKNEHYKDIQVGRSNFVGYISKVHAKIPIEIECEDNFYLLKLTPINTPVWAGNILGLCQRMCDLVNAQFVNERGRDVRVLTGYEYHEGSTIGVPIYDTINPYPEIELYSKPDSIIENFSLGHLDIGDLTCAQVLSKLKSQYHLPSFFVGNVLHFGAPIYREGGEAKNNAVFEFNNNISEDGNLEYVNKRDIILSAVVNSYAINKTGKHTKDGEDATRKEKLSVLIYWDIPTETFKHLVKGKGDKFPPNTDGERHEFPYPFDPTKPNPTVQTLVDYGTEHLKKYYYTGFKGSFTTFGFPFVNWNDNVTLLDNVMADRNGVYKVKKVVHKGGTEGLSQEIHLDFKFNVKLLTSFQEIYMI